MICMGAMISVQNIFCYLRRMIPGVFRATGVTANPNINPLRLVTAWLQNKLNPADVPGLGMYKLLRCQICKNVLVSSSSVLHGMVVFPELPYRLTKAP